MNLRRVACLSFLAFVSAPASNAHPHVFIDARAGFVLDDEGQLTALRITWTYDAFSSLTLLDILDLDADGDGVLSDGDIARLVEAQTIWPDDFEGDTYLEQSGVPVALTRPTNGTASMPATQISVAFDLPLEAPLSQPRDVVLRLYDPTYYFAYSATGLEDTPAGCASEIVAFQPDNATSALRAQLALLSREETPEQEDVGRLFSDLVMLSCE